MGSRGVREGVPPQSRLAPPAPAAAPHDGGGAEREAQAAEVQPASQPAQHAAVGVGEVARIAVRAAHEGRDLGAVAGIQTVPVVAAGTEDLEEDEPGNEASEHAQALPGVRCATRVLVGEKPFGHRGILGA
jgi:hypothetical protein